MGGNSSIRVLIADEIGHVIAALKDPGERPKDLEFEFQDSLRVALNMVRKDAPAVVVVAQTRPKAARGSRLPVTSGALQKVSR